DFVVLSACKDDQSANDLPGSGAFTETLLKSIKQARPNEPIAQAVREAGKTIVALGFNQQDPQVSFGGTFQRSPESATLGQFLNEPAQPAPGPTSSSESILPVKLIGFTDSS